MLNAYGQALDALKRSRITASATLAILVTLTHPRVADACSSQAPPQALVGYPNGGETDVPTDTVPIYDLLRATHAALGPSDGSRFVLRSASGTVTPVSLTSDYAFYIELKPAAALEAHTAYTLEASLPAYPPGPDIKDSITFTTGAGPAQAPAPPNGAFLQHYSFDGPIDSCGPPKNSTCIAIPEGLPVTASFFSVLGITDSNRYFWPSSVMTNLTGINQGTPWDCVRLRSRARNGVLSEPLTLCRGLGASTQLTGSPKITCKSTGLVQDGHPVPQPVACALSPSAGRSKGGTTGSAALSLLGLLWLRRRRAASLSR